MQHDFPNPTPFSRRSFLTAMNALLLSSAARHSAAAAEQAQPDLTEIAPGIFVHRGANELVDRQNRGDICNQTLVIGREAAAIIDTSGSAIAGAALRAAAVSLTKLPVRYVINTHMHPDHTLGNAAFEGDGVEFIGHHKLPRALAARSESYLRRARDTLGDAFDGTRVVLPTRTVDDTATLDLGDRQLILTARPTAHTDNDLTVFDQATATLIAGDLLFAEHIPTIDGSIVGWLKLLDAMKSEQASRVVPGHGPRAMPWPTALTDEQRYLETLAREVRDAIGDGKTMSEAIATCGQSEKEKWQLFDEHHARNVTAAFAELEWE